MLKAKPKLIPLTQNRNAIVDNDDFYKLAWMGWRFDGKYAVHKISKRTKSFYPHESRMFMHNLLMRPPKGFVVDHINNNGLDNRKENLRIIKYWQNNFNRLIGSNNKSGYRGVSLFKQNGQNRWRATIRYKKELYHIGLFDDPKEAAFAWNERAIKLFGSLAHLNEVKNG